MAQALVDSGGGKSFFIYSSYAVANFISLQVCAAPLVLELTNVQPMHLHRLPIRPFRLRTCFGLRTSSPHYSIILGLPWLQKHNPTFNWQSSEILS